MENTKQDAEICVGKFLATALLGRLWAFFSRIFAPFSYIAAGILQPCHRVEWQLRIGHPIMMSL